MLLIETSHEGHVEHENHDYEWEWIKPDGDVEPADGFVNPKNDLI